ncbi:chromosome partitioning protein ParA [Photobacterium sanctipauli]|uniref:Chromosome partitioning protein ParA n=1 Tax=Photobacterium sanctipauli TaxID=1342794 RepID=A0A2T3NQ46_9GAMM|nr:P-loop NTPase [Photobacterium sanctipauli]PSW18342.1 chromosome partitioning protein ParA [Photobacterium sanctipauli]
MFDLAKAIAKSPEPQPSAHGPAGCTLFYQTPNCKALVEEVFRFEGWAAPECRSDNINTTDLQSVQLQELVLLELNQSSNVVEDARSFASQLPNHNGVIVIGKEDAITTLRGLKDMGFYYLFWPVGKEELTDFIRHVHNNQKKFAGVSQNRKAKTVAVVGSKGGVGTSLFSAEIATALASSGADCVLVDHQYHMTNMDIMLGKKDLNRHDTSHFSHQLHDMDEQSAADYLIRINKKCRLLSVTGEEPPHTLFDYTRTISDLLIRQTNFIIDDFSGSVRFPLNIKQLAEDHDICILIVEPSVTSARNTKKIIEQLQNYQSLNMRESRIITILNAHRPEPSFAMNQAEIEAYLGRAIDVVMPFDKNTAHHLLSGKRLHKLENSNGPLTTLIRLIKGQAVERKAPIMSKIQTWFKR